MIQIVNPFQANCYLREIRAFTGLYFSYWNELSKNQPSEYGALRGEKGGETQDSLMLRQQISRKTQHIVSICSRIECKEGSKFFRDIYVFPSNMEVYDVLKRIEGQCELVLKEAWSYWLRPWNWAIEFAAFIVRIPFLILRRAGLPPSIEENILSQVIKIVFMIIWLLLMIRFGLEKTGIEIADILKVFSK
jgi:hypothetical protein